MKNNKGFTLVELLAMLVVLGVLMGVTIPNITGILNQSKKNNFIQDATKMVESAKIKIATHKTGYDKIPKIGEGQCVVFTLDYLNDNEDIGKGPSDGTYLDYESFVIYKLEGNVKKYYVTLIEKKGEKYSGFTLKDYNDIEKNKVDIESITGDFYDPNEAVTGEDVSEGIDLTEESDGLEEGVDAEESGELSEEEIVVPEEENIPETKKPISEILENKVSSICTNSTTTIYK